MPVIFVWRNETCQSLHFIHVGYNQLDIMIIMKRCWNKVENFNKYTLAYFVTLCVYNMQRTTSKEFTLNDLAV